MNGVATVNMKLPTSNVDRIPLKTDALITKHQPNFSLVLSQLQLSVDEEKNEAEFSNDFSLEEVIETFVEEEFILTQEDLDQLQSKCEDLPIELQQEFINVLLENKETLINQISSWSEGKQLLFLTFSYQQIESLDSSFHEMFEKWMKTSGQSFLKNHNVNNESDLKLFSDLMQAASTQKDRHEGRELEAMLMRQGMKQELSVESSTETAIVERMSKMEQVSMHIGDRLPKEMQQQQFIRQLQSIIKRGSFSQNSQGANTLSIKLYPEHLGRLTIQLSQVEGVITARIITGSLVAKELIETQITQLRQAFAQQQLQVDRIDVLGEQQGNEEKGEHSSRENNQTRRKQADKDEKEDSLHFHELLEKETINEQI
jgi:flagellar hook-length control protein FliK